MINRRLYPKWFNPHYYGLCQLRKNIVYVIDKHIKNLPNKTSILDYGCGTSPYKELFTNYIDDYSGADITENPLRQYDLDIKTSHINAESNIFDVILSTQVLEHVESPTDYLNEAHRIAKYKGILILSTHGFFPYHPNPNDYWRWTKSGLHKLLRDNGWECIETIGIIGYIAASLSLVQYSIAEKLPHFIRFIFEIVMQRLIAFIDWFYSPKSRAENAIIYLIVARKSEKNDI
jgi:SAM-dependent methyltransferase